MAKRALALAVLLGAAVGTTAAGGPAFGGHSTSATNTAAQPASLVTSVASLSLGSQPSPTRDHALSAMNAAPRHTGTSATGGVAGNRSEPKSADASDSKRTKTIQVHSHYTEPPGNVDGAQCRGLVALTPDCKLRYVGTSTFTGTMWGDENYDLTGWVTPDGQITYEGYGSITGGVEGCGTGSFIFDGYEGSTDMKRFDPVTHGAPGHVKWRLRTGSGTGELTNLVSGEGEVYWTDYFTDQNGDTNKSGEGDFTGTITCRL